MRIVITGIFCLIVSSTFSQNRKDSSTKILLDTSRIKNQKLVTLIETQKFVVTTTYSLLTQNFKAWLRSYPDITGDKQLYDAIVKEANTKDLAANEIAAKLGSIGRLNYRTAELLNEGKCFVYDKLENKWCDKIRIVKYSNTGVAGTKYFITRELILDVIEQIFEQTN